MLTVGIDTYITVDEATAYVCEQYVTMHPLRVHWSVLTEEERETYLKQALRRLENLNYVGSKIDYYQPLKFPRIAYGRPCEWDKVPLNVKRAQAIMALEIIRKEYISCSDKRMISILDPYRAESGESEDRDTDSLPKSVYELLHEWVSVGRKV